MASKYWIKLYHEILHDPKMGRLPDNVWRRAIELFLLAGELDEDGKLPETEEIAWLLRQPDEEQLEAELTRLEKVGIMTRLEDGWLVTKFADRQAAISSTDRVKEFRKRQRLEQFSDKEVEQEQNDNETQPELNETENETFRSIDTDKDTDKEERESNTPARVRDPLVDMLELQGTIKDESDSYPQDQYFEYRDEYLAIYQEMTGQYPDQVIKDQIPKLEEAKITPAVWRQSWVECRLNWGGNGKVPISRVIEVSKCGGTWEKWRQSKYPDNSNGRDSPQPFIGKVDLKTSRTSDGGFN